jgi:hypothetical protein
MEIKNFKTKFALEDVVYFMYKNELSKGIITCIKVEFEEEVYIHGSYMKDVIHKIKNFFDNHKTKVKVYYSVDKAAKDDTFYCAIAGYFKDWELAHTKEELFKMLEENSK